MSDIRFASIVAFFQTIFTGVIVGIFSAVISHQIQKREIEIKEQDANARFIAQAITEDVGVRRRLAQYFSSVTRSEENRARWQEYAKAIEVEYEATQAEVERLKKVAATQKLDAAAKDITIARIEELEQELSAKPKSTVLPDARLYIHIPDENYRPVGRNLSRELENFSIRAPGIELRSNSPNLTELRYFKVSEKDEAGKIADIARRFFPGTVIKYVPNYESGSRIRPRHYELWVGTKESKL